MGFARGFLKFFIHIIIRGFSRTKIIGQEKIPKEGAYIFCANHIDSLDPLALLSASKRNISFMAKEEVSKNLFGKIITKVFDIVLVKRNSRDFKALEAVNDKLKNGELVGIFPEGTREGILKGRKAQNGAIYLALKNNVKIIPVGISGKFKFWSKNIVRIGDPIDFNKLLEKTEHYESKEVLNKYTEILMENIFNLLEKNEKDRYIKAIQKRKENLSLNN